MLKQIYVYLVLFVTLMMVIYGMVSIFRLVADIINPIGYIMSFQEYKRQNNAESEEIRIPDAKLQASYDIYVRDEKQQRKNENINSLITKLGLVVIPLPIFLWFNRLRKDDV